ncbi:exodeoxyribonuclease V subunit gamma [Lysobacter gummosus]|uniref:RecBCD enzyme subunit RecC n=1 Tax=Lysobacter gummosus TaxID=262324 RepID=A0ABY3XB08_9GAMM|nr:exodeoxyribonuclease V subunit gamma [Lysobacter gummosus]ALN89081.1 exodeoxyribonuclease V, gamma subunit [Lysobacter gummosus]UNP29789.1 exodeoxyribonuclease V subunit gamma [Lysobacter gummosus]
MSARPDFRLYHSNALDVLAGMLAQELRAPAPGQALLTPDTVLIPQVAMRRWLQATLAQAHGIAANLEFLTPGEFVQRALEANETGAQAERGEDLDAAALHWRVYATLSQPAQLREPALAPLRAYLEGDDPIKAWSLSGELASLFEKYQAWRRDWLLAWDAGHERNDAQAALWRRVAAGRRYRARRIDDYLARFGADHGGPATIPRGLPPRLFAFATLNISPDVLRVIATQALAGTLHFYLPTPTRKYWGDLGTLAERLRQGEDAAFGEDDNPLLQAWGAAGRDFMAVLGGYEVVHPSGEIAAYADPEESRHDDPARDSLLQRLQRDLLHRRALPSVPWRAQLDRADASVQVHACHTRLREVQVLHDQLQALLDRDSPEGRRFDPPLQPREIAVLAPDIDPYAPHIAAVFGGLAGRPGFIPYALADVSPLAAEPLAEVFLRLLALPVSRFGLSEILDLLATAAIAEQAGLDSAGLDRLRLWLGDAGARWGIDAAHRSRHDAPGDDAYTWAFALDRLLIGHAAGGEEASHDMVAGIAPYAELEGASLDALDALIRLLRVLARFERGLAADLSPAQWSERLLGLLRALLPERPREAADQRTLERLRSLIERFASDAAHAGYDGAVPPEVVRAHFRAALAEADTRAPLLTGGVSFGRMVPMRLIPFRAICLLGMNDGDYPRRDPAGGLNRLAAELGTAARRHGDRSLRDDDRFLFLQLFAAASDTFYLSYLGADPRDGSQREPSTLVSELLDVIARYHADPARVRAQFTVREPLQPFAPAAFGADAGVGAEPEPRRFSYRGEWRPAVDAGARSQRLELGPWLDDPLPPDPPPADAGGHDGVIDYRDLRSFLRDPPSAFLRQRLGLKLPDEIDSADDVEPLVLPGPGLFRQQLQRAVFDDLLAGDGAIDRDRLQAALRARALLPSGPLGRRQLDALLGQVRPFADAFARWRSGEAQALAFDLDLGEAQLRGRLDDVYAGGLARLRFDTLHGPSQIAHGLDWLVLSALGDARPLAQFAQAADGPGPHLRPALSPPAAQAALRALLRLRDYGLRMPLPFLPRAGWLWYEAQAQDQDGRGHAGWNKAETQWHGSARSWGEASPAGVQLALRGRDPFLDPELGEQFRGIARLVFDAVVHGRDEDGGA